MSKPLDVNAYIPFSNEGEYGENLPITGSITETEGYATVPQIVQAMIQYGNYDLHKLLSSECDQDENVGFAQQIRQFTDIADLPQMKACVDSEVARIKASKVKPTETAKASQGGSEAKGE